MVPSKSIGEKKSTKFWMYLLWWQTTQFLVSKNIGTDYFKANNTGCISLDCKNCTKDNLCAQDKTGNALDFHLQRQARKLTFIKVCYLGGNVVDARFYFSKKKKLEMCCLFSRCTSVIVCPAGGTHPYHPPIPV